VTQPELFVVCKNCGSEVSPYVTECPYCGQRVRKRAPKLERGSVPVEPERPKRAKRRTPRAPRLRSEQIAGIAPDTRPYATLALVLASLLVILVFESGELGLSDLGAVVPPIEEDSWRLLTTSFVYDGNLGYAFIALGAAAIFGTLLERRFGPLPVLAIFVLAGAAGAALAVQLEVPPLFEDNPVYAVLGANGSALGLLTAWLVDDRLASRRGEDRGNDLIGVGVVAAALLLLSLAVLEANIAVAVGGAVAGALIGLMLPLFTRRSGGRLAS
jgi:membrane associated rhomboid family serine protease